MRKAPEEVCDVVNHGVEIDEDRASLMAGEVAQAAFSDLFDLPGLDVANKEGVDPVGADRFAVITESGSKSVAIYRRGVHSGGGSEDEVFTVRGADRVDGCEKLPPTVVRGFS